MTKSTLGFSDAERETTPTKTKSARTKDFIMQLWSLEITISIPCSRPTSLRQHVLNQPQQRLHLLGHLIGKIVPL